MSECYTLIQDAGDFCDSSERCVFTINSFNYPLSDVKLYLNKARRINDGGDKYIVGYYIDNVSLNQNATGVVFKSVDQQCFWYNFNFPSDVQVSTKLYGIDLIDEDNVKIVGTVDTDNEDLNGFLYQGPLDRSGSWTQLRPDNLVSANTVITHTEPKAIMNNAVVGGYGVGFSNEYAFVYDIDSGTYYDISYPLSEDSVANGVWFNENSYTVAGTYRGKIAAIGYLVDLDHNNNYKTSNWKSFYSSNVKNINSLTYFNDIAEDGSGGYNIAANINVHGLKMTSFVNVKRTGMDDFGTASWSDFSVPNNNNDDLFQGRTLTDANGVFSNSIIGSYTTLGENSTTFGFIAMPNDVCFAQEYQAPDFTGHLNNLYQVC